MTNTNIGEFEVTIEGAELAKGIRPTKGSLRNAKFLTQSKGAVGYDGVLQALSDLNEGRVDTAVITDDFPYPQIFVFTNTIIVCDSTHIYEIESGVLTLKLTVTAGIEWSAVDFRDFIYMSNGKIACRRRASDKVWEETTDLPIASAICNFNGQVLVGAPDVEWT